MTNMTDHDIAAAVRRRIQAQALLHLAGKEIDVDAVFRLKKAGIWSGTLSFDVPADTADIVADTEHPKRVHTSPGPLVIAQDDDQRGIIFVSHHFLANDLPRRQAAFLHFRSGATDPRPWLTPYTLELLNAEADNITASDEKTWLEAGLKLHDAIRDDFFANLAAFRQCVEIHYDDGYRDYLERIMQPSFAAFEHVRPPIWDPAAQQSEIRDTFATWVSTFDNLEEALSKFLDYCGYLPLARQLSLGGLLEVWHAAHRDDDLWGAVWKWVHSSASPLAAYHACYAFSKSPEWIPAGNAAEFEHAMRTILEASQTTDDEAKTSPWHLRQLLIRHYQFHFDALAPGLNGTAVATYACWIAEMIANVFRSEPDTTRDIIDKIVEPKCRLSTQRWNAARSRMTPSSLRSANLFSRSIWSESLVPLVLDQWEQIHSRGTSDEVRILLLEVANREMCGGRLTSSSKGDAVFAFDEQISLSHSGLSPEQYHDEPTEAARRFVAARQAMEIESDLGQLLDSLADSELVHVLFVNQWLRSEQVSRGLQPVAVKEVLLKNEWRSLVFQGLQEEVLDPLFLFLVEWQLQQTDEWYFRVPHILAFECERTESDDRRELLMLATLFSSLAIEVASPVARLLKGPHKAQLTARLQKWLDTIKEIADRSEPWLAARLRGLVGTLAPIL